MYIAAVCFVKTNHFRRQDSKNYNYTVNFYAETYADVSRGQESSEKGSISIEVRICTSENQLVFTCGFLPRRDLSARACCACRQDTPPTFAILVYFMLLCTLSIDLPICIVMQVWKLTSQPLTCWGRGRDLSTLCRGLNGAHVYYILCMRIIITVTCIIYHIAENFRQAKLSLYCSNFRGINFRQCGKGHRICCVIFNTGEKIHG